MLKVDWKTQARKKKRKCFIDWESRELGTKVTLGRSWAPRTSSIMANFKSRAFSFTSRIRKLAGVLVLTKAESNRLNALNVAGENEKRRSRMPVARRTAAKDSSAASVGADLWQLVASFNVKAQLTAVLCEKEVPALLSTTKIFFWLLCLSLKKTLIWPCNFYFIPFSFENTLFKKERSLCGCVCIFFSFWASADGWRRCGRGVLEESEPTGGQ